MSAVVIDAGLDAGAALHYGEPFPEARELSAGRALTHLSSTAVLTVTGEPRLQWLHLFLTQACETAQPGESIDALILTPTGHIEFGLHVIDDGATAWVLTDRATKAALLEYLKMMVFTYQVSIADVSDEFAVLGGIGEPPAIAGAVAIWRAGASFSTADPALDKYVPQRPSTWPAFEAVVPRTSVDSLLAAHGAAGMWAWESLRAAAGVPRVVLDADHRSLPHELGLIGEAVHLRKGCYRGQEAVARTYNLGKPPRRLVLLHLDGSNEDVPAAGADVSIAGEDAAVIGQVSTVVRHYELGPIALALVKRSVPSDALLSISAGAFTATQQPVVVVPDEVSPVEEFRRAQRAGMSQLKDDSAAGTAPPAP